MRLKDLCEEANKAPELEQRPAWMERLKGYIDRFWEYRFPGVKHPAPFRPRKTL